MVRVTHEHHPHAATGMGKSAEYCLCQLGLILTHQATNTPTQTSERRGGNDEHVRSCSWKSFPTHAS